ncbi:MAG TPA: hypothetical protein VG165_17155 [Solirubrobacteraceae bacterium]|nr:hypothetical protein [Solirubrobacteraceae bacterium]
MRAVRPRRCAVAALLGMALVAAGCGGSSPSGGVAHLDALGRTASASPPPSGSASPDPQAALAELTRFAACVRAHGVPEFPDPKLSTGGGSVKITMEARPGPHGTDDSASFQSAQQACRSLLPAGPSSGPSTPSVQVQSEYLKAVACVRSHGIPNLRDPTFAGGVHVSLPAGLDQSSPQVVRATAACGSLIAAAKAGG